MSKITNDRLNPVWEHRMLYSCTRTATVGVKWLNQFFATPYCRYVISLASKTLERLYAVTPETAATSLSSRITCYHAARTFTIVREYVFTSFLKIQKLDFLLRFCRVSSNNYFHLYQSVHVCAQIYNFCRVSAFI